jgi:two-component system, chemotaxis family, response regulator Rcp1
MYARTIGRGRVDLPDRECASELVAKILRSEMREMETMPIARPAEILLIEDNPGDVLLIQEALRTSGTGSRLHVAEDGTEAMAFLRREGGYEARALPDLIILDLNIPKRDGREVLAEIKSDPEMRRIPVVILTTSDADEDVAQTYDLHANCYITKPVDFDRFTAIVRLIESFWLSIAKLPGR